MPYLIARGRRHDFSARVEFPTLAPGEIRRIGRSTDAEIQLADRSVSKQHATIEMLDDGRFRVIDLGSKNGLSVGGKRQTEIEVAEGERFTLGNLELTIRGVQAKTFKVPDGVPRPDPSEHAERAAAMATEPSPRSKATMGLLVAGGALLVAGLGWFLAGLGADDSTTDPGGEPAAVATGADLSGEESAVEGSGAEESGATEIDAAPPEPSYLGTITLPAGLRTGTDEARPIESWTALPREWDVTCSTSNCHVTSEEAEFRVVDRPDLGRWQRNVQRVHARRAWPVRASKGWQLPAFGTVPPHDQPFPVTLSGEALDALENLRAEPLALGSAPATFEFGRLSSLDGESVQRARRVVRTLFGRDPTLAEIEGALGSLRDVVAGARTQPEFWRARAAWHLRGRGALSADGGFPIPVTLDPSAVPTRPTDWAEQLEREMKRAGSLTIHPFGSSPPLPREEDDRYVGWLLERVAGHARPLPLDHYARSVWTVLWGRAPDPNEDELLREAVAASEAAPESRGRILDALLYAPSMPFPAPSAGEEKAWVRSVSLWLLARPLPAASIAAIGSALSGGGLDSRLILRAMLLSRDFALAPEPRQQVAPAPGAEEVGPRTVRIDAFAPFSVRALFGDPKRIPRLWSLCATSWVQLFASDSQRHANLASAMTGVLDPDVERVVSHIGLVPPEASGPAFVLTDGYARPSFRRLADHIGDPKVLAPPADSAAWLATQLGIASRTASAVDESLRLSGFRIVPGGWEAKAHRPATRAILAAAARIDESPRLAVTTFLSGPGPVDGEDPEWREFIDAVEILVRGHPSTQFDLWLWGRSALGKTETVRLRWGPGIDRGWVQKESLGARHTHPDLQSVSFEEGGRR
ncbi:MAG: FHA domain-containing protein [Planctomycetota bacterium]